MPATVTLNTTTLATPLGADDQYVNVVSVTNILPGNHLYVVDGGGPGELVKVLSLGVGTLVKVIRGVGGTKTGAHSPASTVYIGTGDQFYSRNPVGEPPDAIPVSPYINVLTGGIWFAQGDQGPAGTGLGAQALTQRWWQLQTSTFDVGPLGVRTTTLTPTAST
jgi:hypothetical protein